MSEDADLKISNQLQPFRFLLADPSPSRKPIRHLLSELLVKPSHIEIANSLEEARDKIRIFRPEFIFGEYALLADGSAAGELVGLQTETLGPGRPHAFMMVSAKGSDSLVAGAAAESIDAIFIKPFTYEALKTEFLRVVKAKVAPPPFDREIALGRDLLLQGKHEEALGAFRRARDLAPEKRLRATAWFYEANVFRQLGRREEAMRSYREAMVHEPAHYRSMVSMLEIHTAGGDHAAAYALAREIAEHHPIPTKLLPEFIRLSVVNKKLEDLVGFFRYAEQARADTATMQHLSAGLAVCGLQYLREGLVVSAVDAFRKAEISSRGDPRVLKRILCALISAGLEVEAKSFLSRAPEDVKNSPELKVAQLEMMERTASPYRALEFAIRLLADGTRAERIYEVAIRRSAELGRKQRHIDDLVSQASRLYPERKGEFEELGSSPRLVDPQALDRKSG